MKVLNIITKPDWAGAQRIVLEIAKSASQRDDMVFEVAVGGEGLLTDHLQALGIKVHLLKDLIHPIRPLQDLRGFFELKDIICAGRYDAVHCHSTKAGILGRLAAKACGVKKIIYTVHGWWPILRFSNPWIRRCAIQVERFLAKMSTDLVLISTADLDAAIQMKIGDVSRRKIIRNAISLNAPPESGVLRRELNLSEDKIIIGNVARVDAQKNPDLFFEVAKQLKSDQFVFVWVGEGTDLERMRSRSQHEGMASKVKFIGFRENGIDYICDFDMLFMTSRSEGVPISILEAIALGKLIFSSNVGGISETIGLENTFTLECAPDCIAEALQKRGLEKDRRSMSDSSYSAEDMCHAYMQCYWKK